MRRAFWDSAGFGHPDKGAESSWRAHCLPLVEAHAVVAGAGVPGGLHCRASAHTDCHQGEDSLLLLMP